MCEFLYRLILYLQCSGLLVSYRVSAGLLAISVMGYTPARSSSCIILIWGVYRPSVGRCRGWYACQICRLFEEWWSINPYFRIVVGSSGSWILQYILAHPWYQDPQWKRGWRDKPDYYRTLPHLWNRLSTHLVYNPAAIKRVRDTVGMKMKGELRSTKYT